MRRQAQANFESVQTALIGILTDEQAELGIVECLLCLRDLELVIGNDRLVLLQYFVRFFERLLQLEDIGAQAGDIGALVANVLLPFDERNEATGSRRSRNQVGESAGTDLADDLSRALASALTNGP